MKDCLVEIASLKSIKNEKYFPLYKDNVFTYLIIKINIS